VTAAASVFAELLATAPVAQGRAYREFNCAEDLHLRAFVDGATRLPGVSFRAKRKLVPSNFILPDLRGVTMSVSGDGGGREANVLYEYSAASATFADVFTALASRLIDDAALETTAAAALTCMAKRVATWANFFDARGDGGLPRYQELGLIGELICLKALAILVGAEKSVSAWMGPTGSPHDFHMSHAAVEAKLTTSSAPERSRS
jgi:hypothetical protein